MTSSSSLETALANLGQHKAMSAEAQRIAGVGTWEYHLESGEVLWSDEMFRIFGVSRGHFEPSVDSFLSRVHPEDRDRMVAVIQATLSGQPMDFSHRIVTPNGEIRHVHDRAEVVTLQSRPGSTMLGTVQDITERKQAEELIAAQTLKLREMQAEVIYMARQSAMGTMAATLAHELNQPLAAISNYASGARRVLIKDPRIADQGLVEIEKNAARAGEIIRRLREMTRRRTVARESTRLSEILKDAVALASKGACPNVDVAWRLHVDEVVEVDPVQIGQVVINLLKNACEASVGATSEKVILETSDHDNQIKIAVKDFGSGLPGNAGDLFEGVVSTKPEGMGMGLSICRTIIESHGGKIGAENWRGGACFWFTLPRPETLSQQG